MTEATLTHTDIVALTTMDTGFLHAKVGSDCAFVLGLVADAAYDLGPAKPLRPRPIVYRDIVIGRRDVLDRASVPLMGILGQETRHHIVKGRLLKALAAITEADFGEDAARAARKIEGIV